MFTPNTFPLPSAFHPLLKEHSEAWFWDLVALLNLFDSLHRGDLSPQSLVDVFFDPSLSPSGMIRYMQSSAMRRDTVNLLVRLRNEPDYSKLQSLRSCIYNNTLYAEYVQLHNMLVLHKPNKLFTFTCDAI